MLEKEHEGRAAAFSRGDHDGSTSGGRERRRHIRSAAAATENSSPAFRSTRSGTLSVDLPASAREKIAPASMQPRPTAYPLMVRTRPVCPTTAVYVSFSLNGLEGLFLFFYRPRRRSSYRSIIRIALQHFWGARARSVARGHKKRAPARAARFSQLRWCCPPRHAPAWILCPYPSTAADPDWAWAEV